MEGKQDGNQKKFDLDERLLQYSTGIIRLIDSFNQTRAGVHVVDRLLRSGTAVLPCHNEAQSADSPTEFAHKLGECLKELRESYNWLLLSKRVPLLKANASVESLIEEAQTLIRIFKASMRTMKERNLKEQRRPD